jgi:ribosome-associated protein
MARIVIQPGLSIDQSEIEERFVLSSGPGGQNVNKVASAVELRFDVAHSPSLSDQIRARLSTLAGRRMTKDGVLVLHGQRFRDQQRNREDVRARLVDLIGRAAIVPRSRKATKPTKASRERRLEGKKIRASIKGRRGRPLDLE